MEKTMEKAKIGQEFSVPSGKGMIMSNITASVLVALQFLWVFILGSVFYGYIDSRDSLNALEVKLAQTESKLGSLTEEISRVENSMKTANRTALRGSSASMEINATVPPPVKEIPKSITTVKPLTRPGSSPESAIKASPNPPARDLLRNSKQFHKVNDGETLYKISQYYGIPVEAIIRLNNLKQDQLILSGQKLLIAPVKR